VLDPNSTLGNVFLGVVASLIGVAILFALGWALGPFKWQWMNRWLLRHVNSGRKFRLIFNPAAGQDKIISFLPGGTIGEGKNENENRWRIRRGCLEIFAADGKLYSRFMRDGRSAVLRLTNDAECRSIHDQSIEPLWQTLIRR
jgi:hypothetical protein